MSSKIYYPTLAALVYLNKELIEIFRIEKIGDNWNRDKHEVRSLSRLKSCLMEARKQEGDLYDKAARLLIELVKSHCFSSANRRTAFYGAIAFIKANRQEVGVKDEALKSKIMLGIREENLYSFEEIATWLRVGKIKVKKLKREEL